MMDFGVSFNPGQPDASGKSPAEGGGSPQQRYQQAVQLLSFRLPKFLGGGALAPAPLLGGQGAQGQPFGRAAVPLTQMQPGAAPAGGGAGADQDLLRALMQLAGLPSGGLTPHVTPGTNPTEPPAGAGLPQTVAQHPTNPIITPAGPGWNPEYYPADYGPTPAAHTIPSWLQQKQNNGY